MSTARPILRRAIHAAESYVKKQLHQEGSHDWQHIQRVRRLSVKIARLEGANVPLVELMALLHEATDWKMIDNISESAAAKKLALWLKKQRLDRADINHIMYVVKNQSYRVAVLQSKKLPTLEGRIVQDADRLEALGAIGIARCFAFGGRVGRPIYDPAIKPRRSLKTARELRVSLSSVSHFYEKVLKIKDLMNTPTGKKLANRRHRFVKKYLDQFFAEVKGKK